jgi:hypothetical protein
METSQHMVKHTPQHRTASCPPKNRRSQLTVVQKGQVALPDSVHLHGPPLPRLAGAGIAEALNVAQRRPTPRTSPRTTAVIVRNLAASIPIRMSLRHLAIGTRKASRGVRNGSARRWTSTTSSDPSSLRQMEATPVAAMRVMADGVGI